MGDLAGSQIIAGASVEITADLRPIQAAMARIKAIAREMESSVRIAIPASLSLDKAKAMADVARQASAMVVRLPTQLVLVRSEAQAVLDRASSQLVLRVPVRLEVDTSSLRGQIGGMTSGGGGMLPDMTSSGRRFVSSRVVDPVKAISANTGTAISGEGGNVSSLIPLAAARAIAGPLASGGGIGGAGGGGGGAAAAGAAGGGRSAFGRAVGSVADKLEALGETSAKAIRVASGAAKILLVAEAGMKTVEGGVNTIKAAKQAYDHEDNAKTIEAGRDAIRAIPIAGGSIDTFGYGIYAAAASGYNVIKGRGFETGFAAGERITEESKAIDAKTKILKARADMIGEVRAGATADARQYKLEAAVQNLSPVRAAEYRLRDTREKFELDAGDARRKLGLDKDLPETIEGRSALVAMQARAGKLVSKQSDIVARADESGSFATGNRLAENRERESKGSLAADRMQLVNRQSEAERQLKDTIAALEGMPESTDELKSAQKTLARMMLVNASDLVQFDREAKRQEREAGAAIRMPGVKRRLERAGLGGFVAAMDVVDQGAKRVGEAERLYGKNSDVTKGERANADGNARDAYRGAVSGVFAKGINRVASFVGDSKAYADEAAVARLRLIGDDDGARRLQYDKETQALIEKMQGGGSNWLEKLAARMNRGVGKAVLEKDIATGNELFAKSIDTRVAVAEAEGRGESQLASVRGQIGQMEAERIAVPAGKRDQVIRAQRAELISLEQNVARPNNYAREWDPRFEAPGGPDGKGGAEQLEVLKAIRDAILALDSRAKFN